MENFILLSLQIIQLTGKPPYLLNINAKMKTRIKASIPLYFPCVCMHSLFVHVHCACVYMCMHMCRSQRSIPGLFLCCSPLCFPLRQEKERGSHLLAKLASHEILLVSSLTARVTSVSPGSAIVMLVQQALTD